MNVAGPRNDTSSPPPVGAVDEPVSSGAPQWYIKAMRRTNSSVIRPLAFGKRYAAW
eukprot:CAMPEP_0196750820 /NCGR_PEP_ID=MMETSP1091-20130531/81782_1 /TAXON_ID=302021 /ORGANISM="Rhodomonas sp., Strain CCMP768" /LENGTH=55 /DNA_ID=CAMNT_0042098499 /DNA_START=108 /DNA_END=275 /DNA_ORIENTATION=-